MFKKWNKARLLKKLQEECFHEYHIVSSYTIDIGTYRYIPRKYHDIYCPICDKTIEEVTDAETKRELEKQKVRNKYKELV